MLPRGGGTPIRKICSMEYAAAAGSNAHGAWLAMKIAFVFRGRFIPVGNQGKREREREREKMRMFVALDRKERDPIRF